MSQDRFDFRRYLSVRSAVQPSFSPDGSRVAFVCDITGTPQAWSAGIIGGWPEQLTFFSDRVSLAQFSPVADQLLVARDTGGNERHQLYLVRGDGQTAAPLDEDPAVMHNAGFWSPDGRQISFASNRREFAYFDVYVAKHETGEVRRVLEQDGSNHAGRFSPDGRALLASRTTSSANNDLFLIDLATGAQRHLTPHDGDARFSMACFASNGSGLYLLSDRDRGYLNLAYLDLESLELRYLVTADWDLEDLALSRDGATLAYCLNVGGVSELRLLRTSDLQELPRPQTPHGVISGLTWSPDGVRLAYGVSGSRDNPNCWLLNVAGGQSHRLTYASAGGIPRDSFVEPELQHFESFDGRRIPAFWYTPAGIEGRVPAVIDIHGGPEGQARPIFSPVRQYLLERGYGVLAPNVRGSTGYGREYAHLDDVRLRMDSVKDIKYAVEWLIASGRADPSRIACMGGSYGGFMVLSCVTTYPELWAAGVDIVGIGNWMTMLRNTSAWRRRHRMAEYGDPDIDGDFLTEISPINHLDRIRAPLMVIHGANDPRVPISEAEQIVGSLKEREQPVTYLRFEDEGHGVIKLENRVACYTAIAEFLDRYLMPER